MGRDLNELHPYVNFLYQKLADKCQKQGIEILVTSTYRSVEEQDKLYAKGRTSSGNIVTNAKGGSSYHNFRLAFDCVPLVNGKCAWDRIDIFNEIGSIGKSLGLEWGGDFNSIKDYAHFQWRAGFTLEQLKKGWYPNDPREININEFKDAVNKLKHKGVINTPEYWINNKEYKGDYVRELIKNIANKLG